MVFEQVTYPIFLQSLPQLYYSKYLILYLLVVLMRTQMSLPCSEPSLALLGQENKLLNLASKISHNLVTPYLSNLLSNASLYKPSASAKLVGVPQHSTLLPHPGLQFCSSLPFIISLRAHPDHQCLWIHPYQTLIYSKIKSF